MTDIKTVEINGKNYISSVETDEEILYISEEIFETGKIEGIDSFAVVGQDIKKIFIYAKLYEIKENAFVGCENLEEVQFVFQPLKKIDLDKAFKKDVKNILFLTEFPAYQDYFKTNDYMIMEYNNVLKFSSFEETKSEILIKSFNIREELYFPDYYNGKEISLRELEMNSFESKWMGSPTKIRFPKSGLNRIISIKDLKEVCYSSLTTEIILPKCTPEKIVMYDKVQKIYTGHADFSKLKTFVIEDSIFSLRNFDVGPIKISPWFNSLIPNNDGSISYEGLLVQLPSKIINAVYRMPNDIIFIPNAMFRNSNLKGIVFNKNIKNISYGCFRNCFELKEVFIPKNISFIGEAAFMEEHAEGKYLKEITFEDKESIYIDTDAFAYEDVLPFN